MPNKLSTHVLDTAAGLPAAGLLVQLFRGDSLLAETRTNLQGRCDQPLLEGDEMVAGSCQLRFHVGDYYRSQNIGSPFLEIVTVDFKMQAGQSYHIPLLCTPWSYSTYRGS